MTLIIPVSAPFSLPAVIRSHGWCQMLPFRTSDNESLEYIDRLSNGAIHRYMIYNHPGGVKVEVQPAPESIAVQEITRRVSWMLSLDIRLDEFYAIAAQEPKLARMIQRSGGRILRSPTLFEDVIKTILTTNTLWKMTLKMAGSMVNIFGEELAGAGSHAFPAPERLAELSEEQMRLTLRVGYRAPAILHLARRVASGDLQLEALKDSNLPTAELRKELLSIKGIGPYAAANLLMILGRFDFLPIDSWALKVVSQEFHGGNPVTPKQVEEAFERWGKWKGLAYWFWDYQI